MTTTGTMPADAVKNTWVSKFKNPRLSEAYQAMKRLSYEHGIFRVYELHLSDKCNVLTVCGTIRLTRDNATSALKVEELDYLTGKWHRTTNSPILHQIPLWPVTNLKKDQTVWLMSRVLRKLSKAAGLDAIRDDERATEDAELKRLRALGRRPTSAAADIEKAKRDNPKASSHIVMRAFHERMFGIQGKPAPGKRRRKPASHGKVGHDAIYNGMKGLRAAFHNHIREPELFRAVLSTNHKEMSLGEYVYFAGNRSGVLKVWSERRNLTPLLRRISAKHWKKDDLFARKSWVGEGCLATAKGFVGSGSLLPEERRRYDERNPFGAFPDKATFQWLAKAKNTVVKKWIERGAETWLVDFMVRLRLPPTVTAPLLCHVMEEIATRRDQIEDGYRGVGRPITDEPVLLVFRAYVAHWEAIRRDEGYRQMAMRLFREFQGGTDTVFDFLKMQGFAAGLPERNATWTSLVRRADEWHAQFGRQNANHFGFGDDDPRFDPDQSWDFAVGETVIDDCVVTPISTVRAMRLESSDMKHCIGSYTATCVAGNYRAYHIVEPDGTRSTLGISVRQSADAPDAVFDQVKGPTNKAVTEKTRLVAREVVKRYRAAVTAGKRTPDEDD